MLMSKINCTLCHIFISLSIVCLLFPSFLFAAETHKESQIHSPELLNPFSALSADYFVAAEQEEKKVNLAKALRNLFPFGEQNGKVI